MSINNSVCDWRGRIVGFRCDECGEIKDRMWDTTCNECREKERRHRELIAAINTQKSPADAV